MSLAIFFALMLALLAFVIWDRRQPAKALSREQLSKGFTPGGNTKWAGFLVLSLAGFLFGMMEWAAPSSPPFSGKGSSVKTLIYEALGARGIAIAWFGAGAAFVSVAIASYSSHRRGRTNARGSSSP